jgi:hypothetical protein
MKTKRKKTKASSRAKTKRPGAKKTAKARKPKADEPTTGQSGPRIALERGDLNQDEAKLVKMLLRSTEQQKIADMAKGFRGEEPVIAKSRVRNALRRLVRARWVKKPAVGWYAISERGAREWKIGEVPRGKAKAKDESESSKAA